MNHRLKSAPETPGTTPLTPAGTDAVTPQFSRLFQTVLSCEAYVFKNSESHAAICDVIGIQAGCVYREIARGDE